LFGVDRSEANLSVFPGACKPKPASSRKNFLHASAVEILRVEHGHRLGAPDDRELLVAHVLRHVLLRVDDTPGTRTAEPAIIHDEVPAAEPVPEMRTV